MGLSFDGPIFTLKKRIYTYSGKALCHRSHILAKGFLLLIFILISPFYMNSLYLSIQFFQNLTAKYHFKLEPLKQNQYTYIINPHRTKKEEKKWLKKEKNF